MKHLNKQKLNLCVLAIVMAFAVASSAYASEITGTLRSSGDNNPPRGEEEPLTDPEDETDDSSVSGNVTSGSGSGSSSSTTSSTSGTSNSSTTNSARQTTYQAPSNTSTQSSSGEVLGASRSTVSSPSGTSSYSSGSLSPSPSSNEELAVESSEGLVPSPYFTLEDEPTSSLSSADSPILNAGSWFWIIMISLFLVGAAAYYMTRPTNELEQI